MSEFIHTRSTLEAKRFRLPACLGRIVPALAAVLLGAAGIAGQAQGTTSYDWHNVEVVGGGFITHIIPDPSKQGTMYARTDVGGAYKIDKNSKGKWQPLTDLFGPADASLLGTESIAIDPTNSSRIYLAQGISDSQGSPNGAILSSQDGGKTFTRVNMPIQMGAGMPGRYSGERLAVDPQHHNVIYFGSRDKGLWKSSDFGLTWAQVTSFPVTGPTSGVGVIFELFVPTSTSPKKETIYAGVSDTTTGLYSSTDGGTTWTAVAGQPTGYFPTNYALSPDGNLYITYGTGLGFSGMGGPDMGGGQLYKFNTSTGVWTPVTPANPWQGINGGLQQGTIWYGFSAVAVDRQNPNNIMVATLGRQYWPGEEIFRSTDGGATWWPIGSEPNWSEPGPLYDFSSRTDAVAPYWSDPSCNTTSCDLTAAGFGNWIGALAIDPFDSNHVYYGTSGGMWETHDVTNVDSRQVIDWTVGADGIEETSVASLISPPQGAPLFSGLNGFGGFRHADVKISPPAGSMQPSFTPASMDFAQGKNGVIVRVAGSNGAYSTDNGVTWTGFTPSTGLNTIAVSADGNHWLGVASNSSVVYSTDFGQTWNNSTGVPSGVKVASDRVNPLEFYAYDAGGGSLYRSTDGGVTFPIVTSAPQWGSGLYTGFAAEGDLWIPHWDGLNHSTDKGATFNVAGTPNAVSNISAMGFGVPAPGSSVPAIYLAGQVSGVTGIFRSTDAAVTWTRINDATHQWGAISVIAGDQQVFGRVYIGTNGRGIVYGDDPAACFTCQYSNKANPVIAWNTPAAVSVGTALSSAQLNATASFNGNALPGSFIYTPSIGTVLSGTGTVKLSVRFVPADYQDYNSVTAQVTLSVNGGSLTTAKIKWPNPVPITYGTALSAIQLNASANYPGTFKYSPALGTVLGGGSSTLTATFTPSDPTKVAPATATNPIKVAKATPTVVVTPASSSIKVAQGLGVTITVAGAGSTPTGTVVLTSGTYTSSPVSLISGKATFTIPKGSLATSTDTLTATYIPDANSSANYVSALGTAQVTVVPLIVPTVTVVPEETTHPYAENLIITATVTGGNAAPTGSVKLSSGSFTSSAVTLNSGSATFYIQPGTLAKGADTLTAAYTPDGAGSGTYAASTGTASITVTSPGSTNIAVNIDTLANRHLISPYIYGLNNTIQTDVTNLSPTFVRMGGNAASDFNWLNSHYNAASDYYFEDFGFNDGYNNPYSVTGFTQFVVNSGSHELNTMPMLSWVAKASGSSFSVAKYGPQCATDYWNPDAGDGLKTDCSTPIIADPSDAYYPMVDTPADCPSGTVDGSTCVDRQTLAQALAPAYGNETCNVPYSPITTCHFYDMDNEPEIWNGSHRDVHPTQPGYTELSNLFVNESNALKSADPSAVTFGPVTCCWYFLWMAGGGDGKGTHAGIDFAPWWLNQVNWMDRIKGNRTLDVFDIHAYFGDNIDTTGFTNPQMRAEVGKFVRQYWDPKYSNAGFDADWITTTQPNRSVAFIIPRMKALVNAIYPGTPLSFTEWESFFNEWEFATALSDADAYGSMGREGLGFSTRWGGPSATDGTTNQPHPNYQSFKLWTNYDGAKHGFGTISVSDQSDANPDLFVSYAALNTAGDTMTIMVLNKDPNNTANVAFNLNGFNASSYTAYTVASTNPGAITHSATQSWSTAQTFAPYSITLLVVSGTPNPAPASEWYLNPDDLMVPASGTGTLNPAITSGTAPVALTSAVFDAYEGAPACAGSLTINNSTISTTQTGTISVNAGATPGFCHYTVTGSDGVATQTQGAWIVVGQPAATFTVQSGNNQSGSAGTALSMPLTVTLTPPAGTTFTAGGASVLFTTSAGTLSNGTTSGTSVIAQTNASGVASVTLTLPSTTGTVTVTAQNQFALGGTTVTFTETAQ